MTVTCHCTSQGCGEMGGRELDYRTQKSHAQKDKVHLVEDATKAAERAVEDQLESIRLHLASSTLADDVSPSPSTSVPGGRMWASAPRESLPDTVDTSTTYSPSRRELIRTLLSRLSEIESSVNTLAQTVNSELLRSDLPLFVDSSSFPLLHLFLEYHNLDADLEKVKSKAASVTALKASIKNQLDTIRKKLYTAKSTWKENRDKLRLKRAERSGVKHSTDRFFEPILEGVDPIHQLSIFLVIACQVVLGQSRRGCSFIFSMLQYLVQLCLMRNTEKISQRDRRLLSDFPADPRPAEKTLLLDRQSTIFAICPKDSCQHSHKPTFNPGSPIPVYPKFCQGLHFGKRCKQELLRPKQIQGKVVFLPIKTFVYFDPKDWIGSLLSEPGLETKMDAAWSQTTESKRSENMRDIFDGEMLRDFKGPDGKHFRHEEDEGRYVFSLGVDFFNPLSNKQAGKKVSVGIISLVCLNLPPDLRYKSEHMCLVGIIPGPHEPPLTTLNHYLTPLVDDFLDFWDPGVRFSRTDGYKYGRLVRCAIVCVVCDLPAARKTAGFGPSSHSHFCAVCHCTRQNHGYGDTNCHAWRRRTKEECLASAKAFNDAQTKSEQDMAFASSGVKWSELLRLPYFDPTRFVVIDAMHNLFLGLINEHFQNILGIRLDKDKEQSGPAINVHFTDPKWDIQTEAEKKDSRRLLAWLRMPLNQELNTTEGRDSWFKKFSGLRLTVLKLASVEIGCPALPTDERKVTMHRIDYARGLLHWRRSQTEIDTDPNGHANSSTKCGHVLTKADMDEIRSDIVNMLRPSWLTSLPSEFGSAGYGKLKADQWRVLGTTFLPVSLVRLWSVVETGNPRSERCRQILDVTMSLLSAVAIACSRVTSANHAHLYLTNMHSYLNGLKILFPDYALHPNHHMALHLPDYLLLYGPVHSWWTFPFERLIGILQRISTNYKIGEYEETISRSFVRSAALKNLILKTGTPEVIQNCEPIFRKFIDPQVRNTLLTDIMSLSATEALDSTDDLPPVQLKSVSHLPDSLKDCMRKHLGFLPTNASTLSQLTVAGITYSIASKHGGNGCILLGSPSKVMFLPARIEHIIQFVSDDDISSVITLVAVRRFKRRDTLSDPFSSYPLLRTQLWSPELGTLELHSVSAIQCHFACSTMLWEGEKAMVVVSLSREF